MYLAEFDISRKKIVQGMVRLPALPRLPDGLRSEWWQNHAQLVGYIHAVGGGGASLRVVLAPGISLHRALFASTPQARSMQLRQFLALFTRLETLVPGSATLPLSSRDYDAVADDVPRVRCRVTIASFQVRGAWLACDFRVAPLLDALMKEAEAYGYRLSYQVNIYPVRVNREQVRAAYVNALDVRDLPGISPLLAQTQQRLAAQLTQATAAAEEYLAVDARPAVQWLDETLQRHFRQQFGALGFETPSWEFVEWGYEDELACAACVTADELRVDELCASVIDDAEAGRLLGWRPSDGLANRFAAAYEPDVLEISQQAAWPANLPRPYDGNDSYVFVSYTRTDLDRIAPIMLDVQGTKTNLWYDRGIPGGAEWHAMLEERLSSCAKLLLFESQAALDSKYVRREVQFADGLNKPIIRVQLEPARLRHGMRFLLGPLQALNPDAPDFLAQLERALKCGDGERGMP